MSRAAMLFTVFVLVSFTSGDVLAQRYKQDVRFQSGNIKVIRDRVPLGEDGTAQQVTTHVIQRDGIHFGLNVQDAKYRRVAATYYHPRGPLGMVMQSFNWFPGKANTYDADARMPASLVALGMSPDLAPLAQVASVWSEPPVAVIGMEAGTPASYAQPFQRFDFYEPNKDVIKLNSKDGFFHFLPDAEERGALIRVVQGPPRQEIKKQPEKFYKVILLEACSGENYEKIFLEFFTKEGIAELTNHLADDGVLCVHTSHRFLDLPPVLAAIGKELKQHVRRGRDEAPGNNSRDNSSVEEFRHFTSEWVMLARTESALAAFCKTPPNYNEMIKRSRFDSRNREYWTTPKPYGQVWTDKGPNLLDKSILRGHPATMGYQRLLDPTADLIVGAARMMGNHRLSPYDITRMPRGLEEWYIQWQLKNHPRVEELWP